MGCYFPQRQEKSIVFEYILSQIEIDMPLIVLGDFNTGKHLIDEDKATFYCAEYMGKLEESVLLDMWTMKERAKLVVGFVVMHSY
jgi:hypothetical protein